MVRQIAFADVPGYRSVPGAFSKKYVLSRSAAPQWRSRHYDPKAAAFFGRAVRGCADDISPPRQNALHFARRLCCAIKQLDASAFDAHAVLQYAPCCALPQPRVRGAGCGENETPFGFGIALILGIDVIEAHDYPGRRVMVQLAILSTIAPGSFAFLNTSKIAQSLRPPSCIGTPSI